MFLFSQLHCIEPVAKVLIPFRLQKIVLNMGSLDVSESNVNFTKDIINENNDWSTENYFYHQILLHIILFGPNVTF
jgi:hypothetical protein